MNDNPPYRVVASGENKTTCLNETAGRLANSPSPGWPVSSQIQAQDSNNFKDKISRRKHPMSMRRNVSKCSHVLSCLSGLQWFGHATIHDLQSMQAMNAMPKYDIGLRIRYN